jgi:hypothetical protein
MSALDKIYTVEDLKRVNAELGEYYFSPDTMRFFRSRVAEGINHTLDGIVFITSEQFDDNSPRLYTIRIMNEEGYVHELACEFQQFKSLREARKHARIECIKINTR